MIMAMEKKLKLESSIRRELKQYVTEMKKMQKFFSVKDKSGRSMKPYLMTKSHIEKTWDLEEEDWDSGITLREYLDDSEFGDVWETQDVKMEHI